MVHPLYFIETTGVVHGRRCKWFLEVDRDHNSRASAIELIVTGEVDPVKVLEVIEPCDEYPRGQTLDVTEVICREAADVREDRAECAWERYCEAFHDGGATQFKSLQQQQIEAMRLK